MESTEKFSKKAHYYQKYRPKYPDLIIDILTAETNLRSSPSFKIADIGSGTGLLSELFLKNRNTIYGVEPNKEMRKVAEQVSRKYQNFISINGTAEATNIQETVDAITAAQSFHWFDVDKAHKEFLRILKPNGYVIIIFDQRRDVTTSFDEDIEQIIAEYGTDDSQVTKHDENLILTNFYAAKGFIKRIIQNNRELRYETLRGMLLSISSIPDVHHPKYPDMIRQLKEIYTKHQINGIITSDYYTEIFYGQLSD
jgi:ubiquinone/menaquinone biosynthesis C-methylase UbiE